MSEGRSLGLYGRLLISYLLVIAAASLTLYLASEALAPAFFDAHLEHLRHERLEPHPSPAELEADLAQAHRQAMQRAVLWGALASAVVAGAVSLFVAGRISAPLRLLMRASRRIAAGHYRERLTVYSPDELGALASSFNDMAGALEQSEARRLELLGNVAHELRTPLSSLHGYLEGRGGPGDGAACAHRGGAAARGGGLGV